MTQHVCMYVYIQHFDRLLALADGWVDGRLQYPNSRQSVKV